MDYRDPVSERVYSLVDKENVPPVRTRRPIQYTKAPLGSWKALDVQGASTSTSALSKIPAKVSTSKSKPRKQGSPSSGSRKGGRRRRDNDGDRAVAGFYRDDCPVDGNSSSRNIMYL